MTSFKIIKSHQQYLAYSAQLKKLWESPDNSNEDDRELLELLIDTWEKAHFPLNQEDPIELIKFLMENHNLNRLQMMEILQINKATLSKILNYKKGLSKEIIRKLSAYFNVSQEAFNRPYLLQTDNTIKNKPIKKTKLSSA